MNAPNLLVKHHYGAYVILPGPVSRSQLGCDIDVKCYLRLAQLIRPYRIHSMITFDLRTRIASKFMLLKIR